MSNKILKLTITKKDKQWFFKPTLYVKSDHFNYSSYIKKGAFNESTKETIFLTSDENTTEIYDINIFISILNNFLKENPSYSINADCLDSYIIITVLDYSLELENLSINNSTLVTHNKSTNIRIQKNIDILDNSYPRCQICGNAQKELLQATNSNGENYKVCDICVKTKKCIICKNPEMVHFIKQQVFIDDEGNLKGGRGSNHTLCMKCCKNLVKCSNRCGSYYDKNKYDICPCLIPHDFKKMIQPYNADVTHTHSADTFSIELFGVEIEAGALYSQRDKYQEIYNQTYDLVKNDAIMVYDSSIDYLDGSEKQKPNKYRGMEIVSRPMTYKNTLRFLKNFSKNRHPLLKSWEVGTAGIHIHTSKAALSRIQIGKLGLFINDKNNRDFLKLIAKREDKKYAKYLTRKLTDYADTSAECHYYALNTRKPNTIEFRIFRGTLNTVTMISYLQFFKSLIDFIKLAPNGVSISSEKNNLYYGDYLEWLKTTEKSQFRELKARINNELRSNAIVEEGEI